MTQDERALSRGISDYQYKRRLGSVGGGDDFHNERNDHRFEILHVKVEVLIVTATAGCHDYASPIVIHWTMRPWTM
jgi:hypothetical protein